MGYLKSYAGDALTSSWRFTPTMRCRPRPPVTANRAASERTFERARPRSRIITATGVAHKILDRTCFTQKSDTKIRGDARLEGVIVTDDFIRRLVAALPRDLLLDLIDMGVARALKAHELIRDHTDLDGRSARGAEGQVRFRLMEKGFQDICEQHGAVALGGGLLPGTELRFFQPFMRFEGSKGGVILGLASMPVRRELPNKNLSRMTGVTLNFHLTPRLSLDASDPKPGDVFVLFLVARDPARSGKIDEIAIGAIDSKYESYLFYETIEAFISNYVSAAPSSPAAEADTPASQPSLIKLKADRKAFKPPEASDEKDDKDSADRSA